MIEGFMMNAIFCDGCEAIIDTRTDPHYEQTDPWGRLTGECLCECCREGRYDRAQERAMEDGGGSGMADTERQHIIDAGRGHLVRR